MTARLEATGEAAIAAAPAKPEEKPEAPVDDAQDDILRDYENLVEENKTLHAIVESTDAGKAALAEVEAPDRSRARSGKHNRGLMNERIRALEQAKDVDAQRRSRPRRRRRKRLKGWRLMRYTRTI